MRRTSAQLKILSVCASLALFLWSSPTFPGLTTGNERKCLSCYHQKVFPFCSFRRSANGCTWFSFQLWKTGECEGCPRVQAPGSPPGRATPTLRGPSKIFTEVRRKGKEVRSLFSLEISWYSLSRTDYSSWISLGPYNFLVWPPTWLKKVTPFLLPSPPTTKLFWDLSSLGLSYQNKPIVLRAYCTWNSINVAQM